MCHEFRSHAVMIHIGNMFILLYIAEIETIFQENYIYLPRGSTYYCC